MPMNPFVWYFHSKLAGFVVFAVGMLLIGLGVAHGVTTPARESLTTTIRHTRVVTRTHLVTVKVKGRVIRRHDHILVVLVPRTVFHTHTSPSRRIVVPRHVVRIHQPPPLFGATMAATVIGVAPPPVTVTVPIYVTGPTTTVTTPPETVTLPQDTTTVTVPTTVTVTLPFNTGGQL